MILDSETTGLDPRRDRLITIGAVAVEDGEIRLEDSFEVMLKLDYNRASVTVHGITRDEASEGMQEREALEQFLDYLRDGVIVGHHIGHDIQTLNVGYERHFGMQLKNRALDTMDLTLHLNDAGAFADRPMAQGIHFGCVVRDVRNPAARPSYSRRRCFPYGPGFSAPAPRRSQGRPN